VKRAAIFSTAAILLLLSVVAATADPFENGRPLGVVVQDEGALQGRAAKLNCTGAGITCSVASGVATLNASGGGGGGATYLTVTADVTNSTTTPANVTGLSFSMAASTRYDIECRISFTTTATSVGSLITWTGPASPTLASGQYVSAISTTAAGIASLTGNDSGATSTASPAATPTVQFGKVDGVWITSGTSGTWQLRFRPETATAMVIKTGSFCKTSTY
jgi:hypothetical protein